MDQPAIPTTAIQPPAAAPRDDAPTLF
jgi:hypothetical protein